MLREYFDWWAGQMLDLVPDRLKQSEVAEVDALLIEPEGDIGGLPPALRLAVRRNGRVGRLGRFPLDEAGLEAARRAAAATGGLRTVWLCLPPGLLLEKHLVLPLAAERDLVSVLTYEMDRETPFSAAEVWWSCAVELRDRTQGKLRVRLSLVPKAPIEDLLEALGHGGLRPTAIDAALASGITRQVPLASTVEHAGRWSLRAVPLAGAAVAALAVLAVSVPFIRQSLALSGVEDQIASLKPSVDEAEQLRQRLESSGEAGVLETQRALVGDPLAVLAAVTALFPNDTFLTDFTMQQRALTLNGQSVDPPKLIVALAGDPAFKDPKFVGPITPMEGTKTEAFSIGAEAEP